MYKYLPPERIDVLEDSLICFNNPKNFNDPFEFKTIFDLNLFSTQLHNELSKIDLSENIPEELRYNMNFLPDDVIKNIMEESKNKLVTLFHERKNDILDQVGSIFNVFNDGFVSITRVLCLSEKKDNPLMWGHYANSHHGFVIEFDKNNSFFNQRRSEKDEYGFLRKVNYQDSISIKKTDVLGANAVDHFLTKSKDWEYEAEWRMLLPVSAAIKSVEFNGNVYDLYKFPENAVKNLILGFKIEKELSERIVDFIKSNPKYAHVNIYKCKPSSSEYKYLIE